MGQKANADIVWKKYRIQLRSFIRSRVSDKTIVDDLLHEVYLKMRISIQRLKDRKRAQSWLYQITRNTIIDHYRCQSKNVPLPRNVASNEKDKHANAWSLISECVRPFIKDLPDIYREALTLSEIKGLSDKQISKKLQLSLPATKSRILRGRKKLKEQFDNCCIFELSSRKASIKSNIFGKE